MRTVTANTPHEVRGWAQGLLGDHRSARMYAGDESLPRTVPFTAYHRETGALLNGGVWLDGIDTVTVDLEPAQGSGLTDLDPWPMPLFLSAEEPHTPTA
jgi:hypothetical protein